MSNAEINQELEASDQLGYEEVVDGQAVPTVAKVELSAAIIDAAYRELAAATREELAAELHVIDIEESWGIDERPTRKLSRAANYRVALAKIEVDRVTALANFLQSEAIFKAAQQGA